MKRKTILFTILILLLLANGVQAMHSTNFNLEWFTPLTGGGGGPADTAHYTANITVGQSFIGAASNTNYRAGIGYWSGILPDFLIRLPLVTK
jgi:hypothetical protein